MNFVGQIDLVEEANKLVSSINLCCFLGHETYENYNEQFFHLLSELERTGTHKITLMAPWLPFGPPQQAIEYRKKINHHLSKIVKERRQNNVVANDYLNEFIHSSKKDWAVEEIATVMLSTMFAARVNSIYSFIWTLSFILGTPHTK